MIAAEADRFADPDEGAIQVAQDNIRDLNESLDRQIAAWELRLITIEDQLRKQFTNLEVSLSQMRSQSNFLAGVL